MKKSMLVVVESHGRAGGLSLRGPEGYGAHVSESLDAGGFLAGEAVYVVLKRDLDTMLELVPEGARGHCPLCGNNLKLTKDGNLPEHWPPKLPRRSKKCEWRKGPREDNPTGAA